MQEVARVKSSRVQEQDPSSAFEMVAPKRVDIASWIAESWHDLSATTIVSGFAKADLLGDTRKVDTPTEYPGIDNITDLLGQLEGLGAVVSRFVVTINTPVAPTMTFSRCTVQYMTFIRVNCRDNQASLDT
ncbi:unnamed protein product [Phytophthora fragariaefolia]|uniref:Unnamed protein product n=1 Tax=Phytophthora fragariaefolia TaxID=1490495 RepID=A0A9W6YG60_9STRA|nr:unnamed protein product [Phytophthora fragariaefolia]